MTDRRLTDAPILSSIPSGPQFVRDKLGPSWQRIYLQICIFKTIFLVTANSCLLLFHSINVRTSTCTFQPISPQNFTASRRITEIYKYLINSLGDAVPGPYKQFQWPWLIFASDPGFTSQPTRLGKRYFKGTHLLHAPVPWEFSTSICYRLHSFVRWDNVLG